METADRAVTGSAEQARAPRRPARSGFFARWRGEPLLHFLLLGVVLFAWQRWAGESPGAGSIAVPADLVRGLRREYLERNGSLPTAAEEEALVQGYIDREVMYREALALGLDRGDLVVRRRLIQKMQFLLESDASLRQPSDAELDAYRRQHAERYATPQRVALRHVFVDADRHGKAAPRVAADLRRRLLAGADPADLGDPFLRGRVLPLRSERELAGTFGARFAAAVMDLSAGEWSRPLRSSYGYHLVRVERREEARAPALSEVRTEVLRDLRAERRAAAERTAMRRLREKYRVRVESPRAVLAEVAAR